MEKKGISQEGLKLIACVTMLLDHIGAVLVPHSIVLRMIGRIAFPIYCFLIAEGADHTRSPQKYALRLFIGLLLSELPFDLAFWGRWTWAHQSVMVTLLFGYAAVYLINRADNDLRKVIISLVFYILADWACTDYGGYGVVLVIMFSQMRHRKWIMTGLLFLVCALMNSAGIYVGPIFLSIELLAVFAMIPISLYSGQKRTDNKVVQWAFYLFYPVHLTLLWLIAAFLR